MAVFYRLCVLVKTYFIVLLVVSAVKLEKPLLLWENEENL